jgi:hypothetical protein
VISFIEVGAPPQEGSFQMINFDEVKLTVGPE